MRKLILLTFAILIMGLTLNFVNVNALQCTDLARSTEKEMWLCGRQYALPFRGISVLWDPKNDRLYSPSGGPAIGPAYIDITRAEIIQSRQCLKLTITVAGTIPATPSSNHVWFAFFLDTDKNPSTGIVGMDLNDLGVDVAIEIHYLPDQGWFASVYDFTSGSTVMVLTACQFSVSRTHVELKIPIGSFNSFNWVAVAKDYGSEDPWGINYIFDHCPNSGHTTWTRQ